METRKRGEDGGRSLTAGGQQGQKRGPDDSELDRIAPGDSPCIFHKRILVNAGRAGMRG